MNSQCPAKPSSVAMAIMREEACAVFRCHDAERCEEAADRFMQRILLRLGGGHVYFPQSTEQERQRVREDILARCNGRNVELLAREHGMTPRSVRRIVARHRGEGL